MNKSIQVVLWLILPMETFKLDLEGIEVYCTQRQGYLKGLAFFTFSFMQPIFPADVMNFVAGLSSISWKQFLIANVVGRLPGVLLLTALGANGLVLTVPVVAIFTVVGLVMFGGWWFFIARENKKEV